MSKTPKSAAIYARISLDLDGTGLGVARQLEDCRAFAAQHGWVIGDEYVDNDTSAYSGKKRPEYSRMLEDIAGGDRDAVIALDLVDFPAVARWYAELMARPAVQRGFAIELR